MVKINSSKTFIVKPAEKTPGPRSITLTIMDKVFGFPYYTPTVHIYRLPSGSRREALRESLSKVLVHYFPVAGRYIRHSDEKDNIVAIDCNDEGVPFVESESDSSLEDLGRLSPSSDFKSLLPSTNYSERRISSCPIMVVKATYFKCGGVSLGIAIEHRAVDGSSAFRLINAWAEISRGLDISIPPFLERASLLRPRDPPRPKFDHQEYMQYPSSGEKRKEAAKLSVFRITRDTLIEMKAKANDQNREAANYTTFETLAGHTWKCVCRARGVAGDLETKLSFSINGRSDKRLQPKLPPGFFGNAVFRAAPTARAGDLQSGPLSFAAGKIHNTMVRIDDEYIRSAIDFLAIQPDLSVARFGPHLLESPNFHLTSWVGLGLSNIDFGWGPPDYSGPVLETESDLEQAFIFSAGGGGLTLAITLQPHHMEIFEKLFYEIA